MGTNNVLGNSVLTEIVEMQRKNRHVELCTLMIENEKWIFLNFDPFLSTIVQ